jgi:glucose/arabinose dehydrogenase
MLRVDVSNFTSSTWTSPPDNPCMRNSSCFGSTDGTTPKETWAIGLRNPWRFTFDREMGDMYIADVG